METIYELLDVEETATKEEIENAYSKLVYEFRQDPSFDAQTNKENEMILNKLKIAYEILIDDVKRKKYDNDLAKKRAESLLAGVESTSREESKIETNVSEKEVETQPVKEQATQNTNSSYGNNAVYFKNRDDTPYVPVQPQTNPKINNSSHTIKQKPVTNEVLSKKEKNEIRKAAQEEFDTKLKKVEQAEKEYTEAYNEAYNKYVKNMKNSARKEKFRKVKTVFLVIIVIIITGIIMWCIPPVRSMLIELYETNIIVQIFVNIVKAFLNAIFSIF